MKTIVRSHGAVLVFKLFSLIGTPVRRLQCLTDLFTMAEEVLVVLNKKDPTCGLGFSLLGTPGLPPIIYDIVENSPAAESGNVEAGDVILKVNETDVNRLNTKEDPVVKARVRHYLSIPLEFRGEMNLPELISSSTPTPAAETPPPVPGRRGEVPPPAALLQHPALPPPILHPPPLNDVTRTNGEKSAKSDNGGVPPPPPTTTTGGQAPRFEAFVMTGDRVLKICRTQQGSVLPKQQRKVDSLRNNMHNYNNRHHTSTHERHNSVPTSPIESERESHTRTNSAGTSPTPTAIPSSSSYVVRTSKSEDHLQFNKDSVSTVSIDIDDDVTSSLNTLLDTRQESEGEDQRIVWTYNAPLSSSSSRSCSSESHRSGSPASPTSVSSSVMTSSDSSDSNGGKAGGGGPVAPGGSRLAAPSGAPSAQGGASGVSLPPNDLSQSEAVSNISSPDFQEEDSEMMGRDLVMEVSDPSDSDSTLLVSETGRPPPGPPQPNSYSSKDGDHRIVIQVKGADKQGESQTGRASPRRYSRPNSGLFQDAHHGYETLEDVDEESLMQLSEGAANLAKSVAAGEAGGAAGDGGAESDGDSLHSYHYSPKAVDIPSAVRLAKRLFTLDGFKKSDVSRHLSKNNDFSRAVAEEYLKYFSFGGDSLDGALRKFLTQFCLTGETQERERVLVHFSKRYLDCNPGLFSSQDAVHTLTCAIMLLNTDLHGQTIGRKMTCNEFIDNLAELNDGKNFPREILKNLYQSIKNYPLEWALDGDGEEQTTTKPGSEAAPGSTVVQTGKGGLFDVPSSAPAIEYKKGYVMRKCCVEPNGKKTPLGKRGWKMYYCTLRDLVLYLHKDEHGFRKTQLSDNLHNAIRIHHSLATKATDYTKKLHVFRLETADQAVYLFQTSDSKELQSWIDTINFVCASFSAQPLPGAVGSQKKFQRPLLPSSHTKLSLREQLRDHEAMVAKLESELENHRKHPPERGAKQLIIHNFREKDNYLQYEIKRYKSYSYVLRSRMSGLAELMMDPENHGLLGGGGGGLIESIGEAEETASLGGDGSDRRVRYSYRPPDLG